MISKMYAGNLAALTIGGGMTFKKIDAYKSMEKIDLYCRFLFDKSRLYITTITITHNNKELSLKIGSISKDMIFVSENPSIKTTPWISIIYGVEGG